MTRRNRYGAWDGGRDPLTPPFDVRAAVEDLGQSLLEGTGLGDALQDLHQRSGLARWQERVRQLRREAQQRGRLDGPLLRAQSLLDQALATERDALADQPGTGSDLAQAQLDALPQSLARAIAELRDYEWASPAAQADYHRILDELRDDVLNQRFAGLKESLAGQDPQALRRMLQDLNALLEEHASGHDSTDSFAAFMAEHGAFFPNNPQTVPELLDELAQQAAAGERLLRSLSPEQRAELGSLMGQAMGSLGDQLGRLSANLQALRPGMFAAGGRGGTPMTGEDPLSVADGASALSDLAELDALAEQLGQQYVGASLDDVDVEAVHRQLGAAAADELEQLRAVNRELRRQGWLIGSRSAPALSPKALRQLGANALAAVFRQSGLGRPGGHELPLAGAAGERTGASRAWQFGDEQPLDVVGTLTNSVRRTGRVEVSAAHFEVVETERRASAAVALCVDLSFSMISQGRWAPMKRTALALSQLITTKFPQDALQIIGFSRYAQPLTLAELALVEPDGVQGTNLQHALQLAGEHLRRHSEGDPIVLVITDGEPTAHLGTDAVPIFNWPPLPETIQVTVQEIDRLTRCRAQINTFMLGDDPGLRRFVDAVARRCGGRVFTPAADDLGRYVIADYLRSRTGRR